jgi:hypothetical protein
MQVKKLTFITGVAILLCVAAVACISIGYNREQAAERERLSQVEPSAPGNTYLLNKPRSDRDYALAVDGALDPPYCEEYTKAGFTRDDIVYRKVDLPFAIFVFDRQGQLAENATTVCCPDITNGEYVGRVGVSFSETEKRNLFEYHKDTLLVPILSGTVDTQKILTLGKLGSKTFVTDGINLDIIAVDNEPHPDDMTDGELKAMAETFKTAVVKATKNWYTQLEKYYGLMFNMQPVEQ